MRDVLYEGASIQVEITVLVSFFISFTKWHFQAKEDAPDGMMTSAGLVVEMLKSNRGDIRKVFPVLFLQQIFLDINFQLPRVPCGRPDYEFHIDEHGFGEAPLIELKDGVVRSF